MNRGRARKPKDIQEPPPFDPFAVPPLDSAAENSSTSGEPAAPLGEQNWDFSQRSLAELIEERNKIVTRRCKAAHISINNLDFVRKKQSYMSPTDLNAPPSLNKPWTHSKNGTTSLVDPTGAELRRNSFAEKMAQKMATAIREAEKPPEPKEFDYWIFQRGLQFKQILEQASWLKSQISMPLQYIKSEGGLTDKDRNRAMLQMFQNMYGPLNADSERGKALLNTFKDSISEYATNMENLKENTLKYAKECGNAAALEWVDEAVELDVHALNLPPDYFTKANDPSLVPLYNVNPLTNYMHSEWFQLPRFPDGAGPANLFIREDFFDQSLVEYKDPCEGVVVINGYWPSLMDPQITHPVHWVKDPVQQEIEKAKQRQEEQAGMENLPGGSKHPDGKQEGAGVELLVKRAANLQPVVMGNKKEKEGNEKKVAGERSVPSTSQGGPAALPRINTKERNINFESFYETLRVTIAKYPIGVSVERLLDRVNAERKHYRSWELFPGASDEKVIKVFAELFIKDGLPGRKGTRLLFPSYMPLDALSAEDIVRRIWKKMVYIVRINGGEARTIRSCDLAYFYEQMWHVNVDIEDWGFEGHKDFVDWAMEQFNADGKQDGLEVTGFGRNGRVCREEGEEEEPIVLLVFKPRCV